MRRLVRNAQVLMDDALVQTDVLFDEKEILEIGNDIENENCDVINGEGYVLLPGLVDVHVHLREPGFEEKETIAAGTKAAAHGGFTTIFCMPNVNPFPDNGSTMKNYLAKIESDSLVHTHPYCTITEGEKGNRVTDFKAMKALGIHWCSDDGVGVADGNVMKNALIQAKNNNMLVACHTENMDYRKPGACVHEGILCDTYGWKGIPSLCESTQLERDLNMAVSIGTKYHGCHISCIESLEALRKAKEAGGDVTAEVTAHHLLLEEKDVKGPDWKMNPPLRSHEDRMALIEALENGTLDIIANDHAPHTFADKNRPMSEAAFGIVSLETSFALLYTEFVKKEKRWTLGQLVNWMSYKPALRFGLEKTGKIAEGWKSDLVLMDLNKERVIHKEDFYSKGKNTPFEGWTVFAETVETIVSGKTVYRRKEEETE